MNGVRHTRVRGMGYNLACANFLLAFFVCLFDAVLVQEVIRRNSHLCLYYCGEFGCRCFPHGRLPPRVSPALPARGTALRRGAYGC